MAWTLAELSKIETDPLRKSVIDGLLMESNLMELVPWETTGTLSTTIVSYQDLPSVGWRMVNDGYAEATGTFKHKTEQISLLGGMIDTDKVIARAKNTIADARAVQQTMMIKAMAYEFNDTFINGDPTSDPLEFKGLEKRIDDIAAEGYSGQLINHNEADIITTDATHMHAFIDALDKLIYAIDGHQPEYLLMNSHMLMMVRSVLRRQGLLSTTQDMFDRRVDTYQGARLVDIGVKADQSTMIMGWEANTGLDSAAGTFASIIAVKFGEGDKLWGLQMYPLEVYDKGMLEAKPVYRTEVDWPVGLAHVSPRSMARLYGVKIKA